MAGIRWALGVVFGGLWDVICGRMGMLDWMEVTSDRFLERDERRLLAFAEELKERNPDGYANVIKTAAHIRRLRSQR
jgi:hypothetical protein